MYEKEKHMAEILGKAINNPYQVQAVSVGEKGK